jgi:hypothetical protein
MLVIDEKLLVFIEIKIIFTRYDFDLLFPVGEPYPHFGTTWIIVGDQSGVFSGDVIVSSSCSSSSSTSPKTCTNSFPKVFPKAFAHEAIYNWIQGTGK